MKHNFSERKQNRINWALQQAAQNTNESKAAYYDRKAGTIENNRAIFSDDPDAITKLEAEIKRLEEKQAFYLAANKFARKGDREGFMQHPSGLATAWLWDQIMTPKNGKVGFEPYVLTNNNQNLNQKKKRLATLKANAEIPYSETEIKGVQLIINPEANRVQMKFPCKPEESDRNTLHKKYGFHWCGSEGTWQRHLSNAAIANAQQFLKDYQPNYPW